MRFAAIALVLVAGCAAPLPLLAGGPTTPSGRTDVALGAATRIAFGELRDVPEALGRDAASPGIAPVAGLRVGLGRQADIGALASGTTARVDVRYRAPLSEEALATAFVIGAGVFGGPTGDPADRGAKGTRFGLDVPVLFTLDASSVAELWVGPRVGLEHAGGALGASRPGANPTEVSLTVVRAGAVLGLALGFRRVHGLAELTASYELATGKVDGAHVSRSGLVLTPAFALRVRF